MDKHPQDMNADELSKKISEEGLDANTANTLHREGIDGSTLWLLVSDFDEFSSIVTTSAARLRVKQFVRKHSIPSTTNQDETVSDPSTWTRGGDITIQKTPTHAPPSRKRILELSSDSESETDQASAAAAIPREEELQSSKLPTSKQVSSKMKYLKEEFQLPEKFSRRVTSAIESRELTGDNRLAFVRECVDFLETTIPMPSKDQFDNISRRLCEKYPSLRDSRKTVYWQTLKDQISQRYRNNRRRTPATVSEKVNVILPKTLGTTPSSSQDDTAVTRMNKEYQENVDALKKLAKQKSPAAQIVQDLLCETRGIRDKWLNSPEAISIHDILDKYPILSIPRWLLHEFESKEGKVMDTMRSNWQRVCNKLTTESPSDDSVFELEKKVLSTIERNVYHRKTLSPVVIEEAAVDTADYFKSKILEPRLVIFEYDGEVCQQFIAAEDDSIMELPSTSVVEGMVYLMATYYVYSVGYPKPYQPILFFIQDFIMDKEDKPGSEVKRPTRYSQFASCFTL